MTEKITPKPMHEQKSSRGFEAPQRLLAGSVFWQTACKTLGFLVFVCIVGAILVALFYVALAFFWLLLIALCAGGILTALNWLINLAANSSERK